VLDMAKGCVKYIYGCFNTNDDDYTCFRYFSCIYKFAIGNDKGEISLYDISTGSFLYQLKTTHEGSVIGL
jgi:WD40 repeat protein